jgi:hypothetical protein
MKYVVIEGIGKTRQCKVVRRADSQVDAQNFVNKSIASDNRFKRDKTYQVLETEKYEYLCTHQI